MNHKEKKQPEIYQMWQEIFRDTVPYMDFYFEKVYPKNEVLTEVEKDGEIKGMIHLNPYTLHVHGRPVAAHYIVGVATKESCRRQGVMRRLLEQTFQKLRCQGEAFTYLMPADEHYYLPFDFRFGMNWYEQELIYKKEDPHLEEYSLCTLEEIDPEQVAEKENHYKDAAYDIFTEITATYLQRLNDEVKSEFGCLFFIKRGEEYVGRIVIYYEESYLSVSQVVCVEKEERQEFLHHILSLCESRYHFGRYQLLTDDGWKDYLIDPAYKEPLAYMTTKKKNAIMFRILDVEKLGSDIRTEYSCKVMFHITDSYIKEQNGRFLFTCEPSGSRIIKAEQEIADAVEGGQLAIADLTRIVFSDDSRDWIEERESLTQEGRNILHGMRGFSKNCILEIV